MEDEKPEPLSVSLQGPTKILYMIKSLKCLPFGLFFFFNLALGSDVASGNVKEKTR